MPAPSTTFLLTLSAAQLNVVRDALVAVAAIGAGSFTDIHVWWGDQGGHGGTLKGDLERVTKKMIGLHPRTIAEAPRSARVAWDLAAAIRLAQAAHRIKQSPDYSGVQMHATERCARVDTYQSSGVVSLGSLGDLDKIPVVRTGIPALPKQPKAEYETRSLKAKKTKHAALQRKALGT
jgi:hypothetical protein